VSTRSHWHPTFPTHPVQVPHAPPTSHSDPSRPTGVVRSITIPIPDRAHDNYVVSGPHPRSSLPPPSMSHSRSHLGTSGANQVPSDGHYHQRIVHRACIPCYLIWKYLSSGELNPAEDDLGYRRRERDGHDTSGTHNGATPKGPPSFSVVGIQQSLRRLGESFPPSQIISIH